MGDIASNPGSSVLKLRKLVGILALLCLYCLPIALLRQWLLRIQASFTEDYSCRYSSGFAPDSLTSAGGYAFPIANSGSKDKDFYTLFCLLFLIILVFLYLCPPNRFRTDVSAVRIKREPGVNPGQSRCCEAPSNEVLIRTFATAFIYREGIKIRSQSEDLPFIKVCLFSWDRKAVRSPS